MARSYPRFLFSNPQNTKSKGPFIVHLLSPRIICRVSATPEDEIEYPKTWYKDRNGIRYEVLNDQEFENLQIHKCVDNMSDWFEKQEQSNDF